MGFSVAGRCVGTVTEAAQVACGQYPLQAMDGGAVVSWACVGVSSGGSSLNLERRDTESSVVHAQTLAVTFPACDEGRAMSDLLVVWGAGVAALALVWALKTFVLKLVVNQ